MDRHITAPISDEDARSLHSGDYVYITGTIYTARDAAHKKNGRGSWQQVISFQ